MYPPKNNDLKEDFLKCIINFLKINANIDKFKEGIYYSIIYQENDMEKNKITYKNEDYYIKNITLSNGIIFPCDTYKDLWKNCYSDDSPLPLLCSCENNNSSEEEEEEDDDLKKNWCLLKSNLNDTIENIINVIINALSDDTIEKKYSSQPKCRDYFSGGQFEWYKTFEYQQPHLLLTVNLGKKQLISGKKTNWIIMSKSYDMIENINGKYVSKRVYKNIDKGVEEIYKEQLVYNYKPNNLFFGYDIYPILKTALVNNDKTILYNNTTYNLIDYKFCEVYNTDYYCGCSNSKCIDRTKEWGIKTFPIKETYYYDLRISCTPEWYIQIMIGSCKQYSNCYRFILEQCENI